MLSNTEPHNPMHKTGLAMGLMERGADVNTLTTDHWNIMFAAMVYFELIKSNGFEPQAAAVIEVMKALVEHGLTYETCATEIANFVNRAVQPPNVFGYYEYLKGKFGEEVLAGLDLPGIPMEDADLAVLDALVLPGEEVDEFVDIAGDLGDGGAD